MASPGHDIVVVTAFELVGVGLLAIIADTSKTAGNVIVMLMLMFAFIWLISAGAPMLSSILSKVQSKPKLV